MAHQTLSLGFQAQVPWHTIVWIIHSQVKRLSARRETHLDTGIHDSTVSVYFDYGV